MDGGDTARTPRHDQGATAPLLEFHQQHCSPSFAAAVAHDSPPRVQPLTAPPQPPRLGAGLGARLNYQLSAQLGGQSSEDVPEQQSQDWPDGLLPAVPPRAAATAAHGRRLAQQQYPSLAQGTVPLPPNRSDEAVVLDHCLDAMQVLAERDVAAAASPSAAPSIPLTQCATLTHTASVSSVAAAPPASHELTGGLGCSQSGTDYLAASNGVPTLTPEREALLVARRDILAAQDQIHVYRVVRTLGVALRVTRLEVGTVRALHAVLLQLARPGMNDSEAYRSTGASRSNFTKWKRRVAHIQSAGPGGGGSAAYEHLV